MSDDDIIQPHADVMQRRVLTRKEAATALGISTFTLDRRIKDGTIHAVKLGNQTVRIPIESIDSLLAGGER